MKDYSSTRDFDSMVNSGVRFVESQWRMWGDPTNMSTFYQMGYDSWKNWTDFQLSLLDTCMKLGTLSLDMTPAQHEIRLEEASEDNNAAPVLKKVSFE